jgi:hypothetical protein
MKLSLKTTVLLKAIDLELKAIIENDIKKFKAAKQQRENNLAFIRKLAA